MIIRPSFTVVAGAAIGLVAGAVVYGAVSTASTASATSVKPAKAAAASPLPAARCAAGQTMEDGVCIIHVERTVVVAAPAGPAPVVAAPSAPRDQARRVRAVVATQQKARLAPVAEDKAEARDHEAKEGADHESPEHSPASGAAGEADSQVSGAATGD